MKLTLKDFGPISEFTLDLSKDLQLIYGGNSVGKSYAVNVLYLLVKSLLESEGLRNREEQWVLGEFYKTKHREKINKIWSELLAKEVLEKKDFDGIWAVAVDEAKMMLNSLFLNEFSSQLLSTYSSLKKLSNMHSQESFKIILEVNAIRVVTELSESRLAVSKLELLGAWFLKYLKFSVGAAKEELNKGKGSEAGMERDLILVRLLTGVEAIAGAIYFLPATRSGYYLGMNSFSPVIAEFSKNKRFLKNNTIKLPTLTRAVSDYIIALSTMETGRKNDLGGIIEEIERQILKGIVLYDENQNRLLFRCNNIDLTLDLSETSSMVAELAPIVTYLKYVLDLEHSVGFWENSPKTNLIIIEEPEAHLHPEAQVKLMEFFAELTKHNIKIILTSHSDFMFNKLGNLILANKIAADKVGSYHLKWTEKGSVEAGDMQPGPDGMEDHNFVTTTEKLYEERMNLLDQQNEARG